MCDEGMPTLVVSRDLLLLLAHDAGLALRPGHDTVDALLERRQRDLLLVAARGEQRGFVDDVGEVGTGESRCTTSDDVQVDVRAERLAAGVHPQDALAAFEVGTVHDDLPVEAARTQQRRVEDVGTVGRGDEDDATLDVETVHLDEQLVQRLLALVVATTQTSTSVPADGVDLVDEDDGRRIGLRLLKEITNPARADTDE